MIRGSAGRDLCDASFCKETVDATVRELDGAEPAGQRFPDHYMEDLVSSSDPMGRAAQPEEVAPAFVHLASDADSSHTVGEVIAVTGGMTDSRRPRLLSTCAVRWR
ncbi:hypothetical protein GCM10010431_53800 [Streptomyces kunmingensis]